MNLPVHRIIPFSNVEGIGNRTSIFVQGCNSNCLYCHNSETIPMTSKDSKLYSIEELLDVIKNQMPFIRGITISGGEPTLYHEFLIELFKEVHKLGLTCYIDANGFFDYESLLPLIDETDKFLFDIKGLGQSLNDLCFSDSLGNINHLAKNASNRFGVEDEHLKNLELLLKRKKIEEVRFVYLKNFYDTSKVIDEIYNLLRQYPDVLFKVIRMHTRGLPKERLKLLKGSFPSTSDFDEIKSYIEAKGFKTLKFIE